MNLKFYLTKTLLCATALTTSCGMENDPNFNRQGMKRASPDTVYEQDVYESLIKKARIDEEITPTQFLTIEKLNKILNKCYENNFFDPSKYSKLNWGEIEQKALHNFKYAHLYIQYGPNQGACDIATRVIKAARIDYNPEGQYVLGYMYWKGKGGVEQNISKAIRKFTKAANSGCVLAARSLTKLYYYEDNIQKELKWLNFTARKGDLESMIDLAERYTYGESGIDEINIEKAIEIYTVGAHMGDPDCAEELAALYKYGYGEDQKPDEEFVPNISEALRWFLESLALENRFCKKPRITTCVQEVNFILRYNASALPVPSSRLVNFQTIENLSIALSNLEKNIRIYRDFINFNALQNLDLLNLPALNDIFVSFLSAVPHWKEILIHLQNPQPNLLLTCLTPRKKKIEQKLIESSSNGIAAYNYNGQFYLNIGSGAVLLSLRIMNALGVGGKIILNTKERLQDEHSEEDDELSEIILKDLGYYSDFDTFTAQILNYQKGINNFITIFKSSIAIPSQNNSTEEMVNLINEIKETLKNYIEHNAYERNEEFIKNHPQLATRENESSMDEEGSVNDEESLSVVSL